jgi:preprotein translocase subunit SecG
MTAFIIVIHIIVCVALILIVLLQTGKGASIGAAFGGSTQTVFGATGSAGFFEKLTTAVAIIFMLTSLGLTYASAKKGGKTVMTSPVAQEEKAVPGGAETLKPDEGQKAETPAVPEVPPSPPGNEGAVP